MIVYLDQNKWIELSKIFHGRDKSSRARQVLKEIKASLQCGYSYPLSAIHYMEFSRISNVGRRTRLGKTMWEISQGKTFVSIHEMVLYEIEKALNAIYPTIKPRDIKIMGRGIANAFGERVEDILPDWMNEKVEETLLTGGKRTNINPISYNSDTHRLNFLSHLEKLHQIKNEGNKRKWDDWLHAIVLGDIVSALNEVMTMHEVPVTDLQFNKEQFIELVRQMPMRYLDLHLHRQVLKNPNYKPKDTDLEDWAGLGFAACYCDIVVCEKHMSDMLKRDKFQTKAKIVTKLDQIFDSIVSL